MTRNINFDPVGRKLLVNGKPLLKFPLSESANIETLIFNELYYHLALRASQKQGAVREVFQTHHFRPDYFPRV